MEHDLLNRLCVTRTRHGLPEILWCMGLREEAADKIESLEEVKSSLYRLLQHHSVQIGRANMSMRSGYTEDGDCDNLELPALWPSIVERTIKVQARDRRSSARCWRP